MGIFLYSNLDKIMDFLDDIFLFFSKNLLQQIQKSDVFSPVEVSLSCDLMKIPWF
jgi:hypothetical protein